MHFPNALSLWIWKVFRGWPSPQKKKNAESLCLYIAIESCGSLTWLNGLSYVIYYDYYVDQRFWRDRVLYDNYREFDALVYSVIILAAIFFVWYILAGYWNVIHLSSRLSTVVSFVWRSPLTNEKSFSWTSNSNERNIIRGKVRCSNIMILLF